jgi:hypothetical protein
LFSWEEWFRASPEQIRDDKDCLPYFATWIQMALDNNNPKTHEETPKTHKETPETRKVTNDQKAKVKKDVDMENAPLFGTTRQNEEKDADIGLFMDAFDDLPEKDETKKLEQDFVDSDFEEQAWKPTPPTSSFKENSSNDEEKKEPVTGPSAKVPKFVGMILSPFNFFFFSNYLLQQH